MRTSTIIGVALAALVSSVGAQAETSIMAGGTQKAPQPVRVVDSGFAIAEGLPVPAFATMPRVVVIVLRIENPNAELTAEGVTVVVQLQDGEGRSLVNHRFVVAQLMPGERRVLAGRFQLAAADAEIAGRDGSIDITLSGPLRWGPVGIVPIPRVELSLPSLLVSPQAVPGLGLIHSDLTVDGQLFGVETPTAAATITNPFGVSIDGVDVSAAAFDREGRIIGGGQRTITLGPDASIEIEMNLVVRGGIDAIARVEVTAAFPYIDLAPYAR